ncbi:MAG: D-alanyl-D-alanine carboxypeptidase [Clostridiales Family XIII bacterium]|jgi:D-alanyl-D-alanine carboxypeptidase (penicillin-binding protein 5/6)|nr:D-alanyl-D-alanine carboxypeptidase [Clostridiales Family XIII bacterium]
MKKIGSIFLTAALAFGLLLGSAGAVGAVGAEEDSGAPEPAASEPAAPELAAPAALLVNGDTGEALYEKDADAVREPASLTKIMTALIAIETLPPDQIVTCDREIYTVGESQIFLQVGEEISVNDLLYAALVSSANDAAVALAKTCSGSVEAFAEAMNARAQQIGAVNTHFVNPHGLHAEGHVTTARDMALIASEAMKNERFRQYVSTASYTIPATNYYQERVLENTNSLLTDFAGATGVKTGTTLEAGRCLVAAATRDGAGLLSVVLGDNPNGPEVFADTAALLEYGFNNFRSVTIFGAGCSAELAVRDGEADTVTVRASEQKTITLSLADADKVRYEYDLPEDTEAPAEEGTKIGTVRAYAADTLLAEVDLEFAASVDQAASIIKHFGDFTNTLSRAIWIGAAVILVLIIFFAVVMIRHTRGRRYYGRSRRGTGSTRMIKRVRRIK